MELSQSTEQEKVLDEFLMLRHKTELLCGPLTLEDMVVSTTQDTSPPKWHLAHTTWFFENFILIPFLPDYEIFSSHFSNLFNSYYLGVNSPLPKNKRSFLSRPITSEIIAYRRYVEEAMKMVMMTARHDQWKSIQQLIEIGMNHEEQHQELLLMDIKQNFFNNPIMPLYESGSIFIPAMEVENSRWIEIEEGLYAIGAQKNSSHFIYDNETDRHKVWVDSFLLSTHLTTNSDYLDFIHDEGYQRPEFWSSDGWAWLQANGVTGPLYWQMRDNEPWEFTLYGLMPLNLEAPVSHISFYEAQAYAKYCEARLPTEAEWEVAASCEDSAGQFLDSEFYHPSVPNRNFQKFSQIHGTLWEWTSSAYAPYPRYESYEGVLAEYNEKFMNQQYVLRGGSCVTPRRHYRCTYRNYYYPQMRWHFCGIRLAKDKL